MDDFLQNLNRVFKIMPKFLTAIFNMIVFIALSIIVVPAMAIMVIFHKYWEDRLKGFTNINPF